MLENPQTEEQMIEDEGAEFKVGEMYFKNINGVLHRAKRNYESWVKASGVSKHYYEKVYGFVDLKPNVKKGRQR